MIRPVRNYVDPHEGLVQQLTELLGLAGKVPILIEADRKRRWDEIATRPGDPDSEMIDLYENEAGAEEGWGFADYTRTIRMAAVVAGWEAFRDCLNRQLFESAFHYNLSGAASLAALVDEAKRRVDRSFDATVLGYKTYLDMNPPEICGSGWLEVKHAQELRNALVHNMGTYTERYLKSPCAARPDGDILRRPLPDDQLIGRELITLSEALVHRVLTSLIDCSAVIREALSR